MSQSQRIQPKVWTKVIGLPIEVLNVNAIVADVLVVDGVLILNSYGSWNIRMVDQKLPEPK